MCMLCTSRPGARRSARTKQGMRGMNARLRGCLQGGSEVMTQAVLRLRQASQGRFLRLLRSLGLPKVLWMTNLRERACAALVAAGSDDEVLLASSWSWWSGRPAASPPNAAGGTPFMLQAGGAGAGPGREQAKAETISLERRAGQGEARRGRRAGPGRGLGVSGALVDVGERSWECGGGERKQSKLADD